MKKILFAACIILALFATAAGALDDTERKKIDFLISSVENLNGVKFVRNGSEYTGKQAAAHLRMKLNRAGSRVRSADDFIRLCASKSYISGQPYLIRLSEAKELPAEEFFRNKLKEYDQTVK
jgi:hypothetical protein